MIFLHSLSFSSHSRYSKMCGIQLRSLPLSLVALMSVILLGGVTGASAAHEPAPSPSANDVELICHTDNPAECYPKVFQPTDEFQIVKSDQDLPSGLHVRLNVYTGLKEAKINVPDEEVDSTLAGLPVDTSMVVIEQPEEDDGKQKLKIPANAPAYDPAGNIKAPAKDGGSSSGAFSESLAVLKKGLNIDEALDMLEDISHDIYYGLKIAEDFDTVKKLFCIANTGAIFREGGADNEATYRRARLAALTIVSAVQNNPKALAEIEKYWTQKTGGLRTIRCPDATEDLSRAVFRLASPHDFRLSDPALVKARASAISGLLKSPVIRREFLATDGMGLLMQVLAQLGGEVPKPEFEPAQRQVALLILDNFLDEEMGAAVGEWPTGEQSRDEDCAQWSKQTFPKSNGIQLADTGLTRVCWDWHVKQLAQHHKGKSGHWSAELRDKLLEQRKANNGGGGSGWKDWARDKLEL
ncbi:hypothetical protein B0H63DRAFT_485220 [Podospora didyma]|uniref:Nucleotide exchange factor SIL1 n=1 Tax=Podospora didyma TaxID=330526 RepID=A0AAE0N7R7_9PEZI|nr:hypothetical protein B0H63DRAFT_485220 [Podospora didyma]